MMKLSNLFLPYQRKWIADRAGVKVYEKSRRIGITWAEAFDSALDRVDQRPRRNGLLVYRLQQGNGAGVRRDRRGVGEEAQKDRRADQRGSRVKDEDEDILAYRIRFASGNKIVALSSRPSNLRGKQGIAIIDEAAFHDDLPGLLKAALAFRIWGGRVHVISTHNGENNAFNELITNIRAGRLKGYSLHRTTFDEAMAQGLYRAICRESGKDWSEEAEREFRAEVFAEYGYDGRRGAAVHPEHVERRVPFQRADRIADARGNPGHPMGATI